MGKKEALGDLTQDFLGHEMHLDYGYGESDSGCQ